LFSGRRRTNDIQCTLEHAWQNKHVSESYRLVVVSLDVAVHKTLGDLTSRSNLAFWHANFMARRIAGFIAGPPCETFSAARWLQLLDELGQAIKRQPRPLRDVDNLWGYTTLTIKEHQQVLLSNKLLQVTLQFYALMILVGGVAVVEHPATPWWNSRCASIFKLDVVRAFASAPCSKLVTFLQGIHGQYLWKPTSLLTLRLPRLGAALKIPSVPPESFPKIRGGGKTADNTWVTSKAKEYPYHMCRIIAEQVVEVLSAKIATQSCPNVVDDSDRHVYKKNQQLVVDLEVDAFDKPMGADFAGYQRFHD
jgi:hypothetical protein